MVQRLAMILPNELDTLGPENAIASTPIHHVSAQQQLSDAAPLMLDPNDIPVSRTVETRMPSITEMLEIIPSPIWDIPVPGLDTADIDVQQSILFDAEFNAAVISTNCEIALLGPVQNT